MAESKSVYYEQALNLIRQKGVEPAYLIFGEEVYLIDNLLEEIVRQFLGEVQKEINYFLRYAPDTSLDEIIALTAGAGLFSEKKVVIYKDFQNLKIGSSQKLVQYLRRPDTNICLILIARADSVSKSIYQVILPYLRVVNVQPLREFELVQFVQDEFLKYQKKITKDAAQALLYLVGDQVHNLRTQILQVVQCFEKKDLIQEDDIEQIVGVYVNQNVFEFIRNVSEGKLGEAIFVLRHLLEKGESPQMIIHMLLRHVLILWKIQGFYASNIRDDLTIQKELKLYPRHFAEYKSQASKWKGSQLYKALQLLVQTDKALKSSAATPDLLLDILTYNLVNLE